MHKGQVIRGNFYVNFVCNYLAVHIADKNRNGDIFCIFLGQENGNIHIHTPRIVVL